VSTNKSSQESRWNNSTNNRKDIKTMDNMLECEKKRRRSRDVSQQIIAEVAKNRTDIKTMENIMK